MHQRRIKHRCFSVCFDIWMVYKIQKWRRCVNAFYAARCASATATFVFRQQAVYLKRIFRSILHISPLLSFCNCSTEFSRNIFGRHWKAKLIFRPKNCLITLVRKKCYKEKCFVVKFLIEILKRSWWPKRWKIQTNKPCATHIHWVLTLHI